MLNLHTYGKHFETSKSFKSLYVTSIMPTNSIPENKKATRWRISRLSNKYFQLGYGIGSLYQNGLVLTKVGMT